MAVEYKSEFYNKLEDANIDIIQEIVLKKDPCIDTCKTIKDMFYITKNGNSEIKLYDNKLNLLQVFIKPINFIIEFIEDYIRFSTTTETLLFKNGIPSNDERWKLNNFIFVNDIFVHHGEAVKIEKEFIIRLENKYYLLVRLQNPELKQKIYEISHYNGSFNHYNWHKSNIPTDNAPEILNEKIFESYIKMCLQQEIIEKEKSKLLQKEFHTIPYNSNDFNYIIKKLEYRLNKKLNMGSTEVAMIKQLCSAGGIDENKFEYCLKLFK